MSQRITLTAADGHRLDAWRADPEGVAPTGGIVLLHAVYGLTDHMGHACDSFAREGVAAIAPALYDRLGKNLVHPYSADGVAAGSRCYATIPPEKMLADIAASAAALRASGKVAISGFCSGGTWAWISAAELAFDAAVIFYGSHVPARLALTPRCPTLLHYGDQDTIVPMADIAKIRAAHPSLAYHIYPGCKHAFFNPDQANYDGDGAALALRRSVAFLERHFAPAQSR